MKKNSTKSYFALGTLFALVSVIAFAVPTQKTAAFWTAYAFTVVAFAAQIPIWKTALGRDDKLKSKFLGFPVVHVGIVYAVVQLIAFAVFMFVPTLPVWSAIVVCFAVAGVSAVCMIAADAGRSEIERTEDKVQAKVFRLKSLQADAELLIDNEADPETKAALTRLAEKIRFSDPMSHEQLSDLEAQIATKISELKTAPNRAEIITEILSLLDERNKKCELLK